MSHVGVIAFWYQKSGMGFVKDKTLPKQDVWLHYSTAPRGIRFEAGMEIEFDLVATARGPQAANVKIIGEKNIPRVSQKDRLRREQTLESGFEPIAWEVADGRTSDWHLIDPLFPEHTICGLRIPQDRVVEGGAYPKNCRVCRGRAARRVANQKK